MILWYFMYRYQNVTTNVRVSMHTCMSRFFILLSVLPSKSNTSGLYLVSGECTSSSDQKWHVAVAKRAIITWFRDDMRFQDCYICSTETQYWYSIGLAASPQRFYGAQWTRLLILQIQRCTKKIKKIDPFPFPKLLWSPWHNLQVSMDPTSAWIGAGSWSCNAPVIVNKSQAWTGRDKTLYWQLAKGSQQALSDLSGSVKFIVHAVEWQFPEGMNVHGMKIDEFRNLFLSCKGTVSRNIMSQREMRITRGITVCTCMYNNFVGREERKREREVSRCKKI